MLHCLKSSSSRRSNVHSSLPTLQPQGSSTEDMPRPSTQLSPTVNLNRAYTIAVQSNSYSEIWSRIHPQQEEDHTEQQLLVHVLQPNRDCIEEALRLAKPNTLTHLISEYFEHSENTSRLCLLLQSSVQHSRSLYHPLHDLLDVLPLDFDTNPLSQAQCNRAFDIFIQFDSIENPFLCPSSHTFNDMRKCFSQLKQQLEHRHSKSSSWVRLLRRATIGPFLLTLFACKMITKEFAPVAQLDAAAMGIFVLHNHLDTIDRVITHLHTAVEGDKLLIRLGLDRGRDRHPIQGVLKQLRCNHLNFLNQLTDLEEHICLCFTDINRARSRLLEELNLQQAHYS